jgi:hypothetical protein
LYIKATIVRGVQGIKTTFVYDSVDITNMALAKVANGNNWPNDSCPGELKMCSGRSGIFFKMDRSKSLGNDNFGNYSELFLAKHYIPLRTSKVHHY